MSYYSDREHGYLRSGDENTHMLFPNWDQTYDSSVSDCSLHMSHNTSGSANYNDYSLTQYRNQNNDWPTLPPEDPVLPEDLADLQIQELDSRSSWHISARERTLCPASLEDSLAVSPPVVERRRVDPFTLSSHSSLVYSNILPNMSPNSSYNTSNLTSPEDNRLSPGTECNTQVPNDQGLGLTKDGRPRKRRPKKSLLHLSEEEKSAHEREVNRGSTARYRRKKAQEMETLEQQLKLEIERKAALEQFYQTGTMELTTLGNEFNSCSLYSPQ